MTAAQWEAWTERAGIMEYEGGLDRKSATLAAYAFYFPGDYQARIEAAKGTQDGEAALYEFLAGLLAKPETAIEGVTMSERTNIAFSHGEAPNSPPMARYEGLEAIHYLTAHGLPIKDFYKPGADADATLYSTATPAEQGKRYKVYIRGRYLCLDIDRNHKDGEDGIANFYRHLESIGKPRALLPAYLRDIDRGLFPFYTETPNGGMHLFFKYAGRYVTGFLAPAVELKALQVSAGWKEGKPYILHGDIEGAPPLPAFIIDTMKPMKATAPEYRPTTHEKKEWGRPSWDKITEWTDTDGRAGPGRNNRAYSLALHAATHDWTEAATLAALQSDPSIDGLPLSEIKTAVSSAYKGKRS